MSWGVAEFRPIITSRFLLAIRAPGYSRDVEPLAGPPFLRLFCVADSDDAGAYGPAWQAGLAPEIEVVVLTPARLASQAAAAFDARPYAFLGHGPWALAALEGARELTDVRPPAQLIVVSCAAPDTEAEPVTWPVTAFAVAGAGAAEADGMTKWRSVTTGPFTLRLLPDPPDQSIGWADAGTLLAIKEEARVWPS